MSAPRKLSFALLCITFLAAVHCAEEEEKPPKCYVCTEQINHGSNEKVSCFDEAFDPETKENGQLEPKTCAMGQNACMKTYLNNYDVIEGRKELVNRMTRRDCATVSEEAIGCDTDKGSASFSYVCYCKGDKCNSASIIHLSFSFLALLISFAVFSSRF